jgi:hypothetical protein
VVKSFQATDPVLLDINLRSSRLLQPLLTTSWVKDVKKTEKQPIYLSQLSPAASWRDQVHINTGGGRKGGSDIPPQVLKNTSTSLVQVEHMDDVLKRALMLDDPETTRVLGISAMPSHAEVSAAPDEPKLSSVACPTPINKLFDFVR